MLLGCVPRPEAPSGAEAYNAVRAEAPGAPPPTLCQTPTAPPRSAAKDLRNGV